MKTNEPSARANELSNIVIGAAIEVHKHLGPGYSESIYHKALMHELKLLDIAAKSEVPIGVVYKGEAVGEGRIDILVENDLIVELKTVEAIVDTHIGQVISYIKATNISLGLIINFKSAFIKGNAIKRVVYTKF
ncbi:MAG: GxxExxY protein [Planctomycetota bacterium]